MGKESEEEWLYVYVYLIHCALHLKLTQHCKSTVFQYKIKIENQNETFNNKFSFQGGIRRDPLMLFATWILRTGRREAFVPEVFLSCICRVLGLWLQDMMGGGGHDNKCDWPR